MKKLTWLFIFLIIFTNSFNIGYIMVSTHFMNEDLMKEIVWNKLTKSQQNAIAIKWGETKIKLVKIEKIKILSMDNADDKFNYDIAILNGGYLVKVPVNFKKSKDLNYYVNPFTEKIAGHSYTK